LTSQNEADNIEKAALIAELQLAGIKHTPEKIVRIAKTRDNKIVFLEEGNASCGLEHILAKAAQFAKQGIEFSEIPEVVIAAVCEGDIVGYQGIKDKPRAIYQFTFKGETKYLAVSVSDNGYIVGANPRTKPQS